MPETAPSRLEGIRSEWVTIPSHDVGIVAFVARPESATDVPALIVVPENLGVTAWRQQETERMAADLGWAVIAMSPYSRLGGKPPQGPFDTQDERRRAAFLAMPDEQVAADLAATVSWVRGQSYTSGGLPALLGFCSGGGEVLYSVCTRTDLAACAVSIYGNLVLPGALTEDEQPNDRIPLVANLSCPVQLHVGTQDPHIPPADVERFEAELARHGKSYEIHRYEGANHVFADPGHPNWDADATAQLWPRVARFLHQHADAA